MEKDGGFLMFYSVLPTLSKVVEIGYGPQGLKTFIQTSTGQTIITNDGLEILKSLHVDHPFGKLVLDSIQKAATFTGDGSKSMILLMGEMAKLMHTELACVCGAAHASGQRARCHQRMLKMGQALQFIQHGIVPKLQYFMCNMSESIFISDTSTSPHSLQDVLVGLSTNVMCTLFPPKVVQIYSRLLCDWLERCTNAKNILRNCEIVLSSPRTFFIKGQGLSFSQSECFNSVLLPQKLLIDCHSRTEMSDVNFVIVLCDFSMYSLESATVISSRHAVNSLMSFRKHQIALVQQFVVDCVKNSVSLVLCTQGIPDFVLGIFRGAQISVLQHLDVEDANIILTSMELSPLTTLTDELCPKTICTAQKVRSVAIGGKDFTHIDLDPGHVPRSLILCGLSEDMVMQSIAGFSRVFKVMCEFLHQCCQDATLISDRGQGQMFQRSIDDRLQMLEAEEVSFSSTIAHQEQLSLQARHIQSLDNDDDLQVCQGHAQVDNKVTEFAEMQNQDGQLSDFLRITCPGAGVFELVTSHFFNMEAKKYEYSLEVQKMCEILSEALLIMPWLLFKRSNPAKNSKTSFRLLVTKLFSDLGRCIDDENTNKYSRMLQDWKSRINHPSVDSNVLECVSNKLHDLNSCLGVVHQILRIEKCVAARKR